MLKSLKTLTAICMISGLAHADGLQHELVAYVADDINVVAQPQSCKEARDAAWFLREMERSDGHVEAPVQEIECATEIFAESTADAD